MKCSECLWPNKFPCINTHTNKQPTYTHTHTHSRVVILRVHIRWFLMFFVSDAKMFIWMDKIKMFHLTQVVYHETTQFVLIM